MRQKTAKNLSTLTAKELKKARQKGLFLHDEPHFKLLLIKASSLVKACGTMALLPPPPENLDKSGAPPERGP